MLAAVKSVPKFHADYYIALDTVLPILLLTTTLQVNYLKAILFHGRQYIADLNRLLLILVMPPATVVSIAFTTNALRTEHNLGTFQGWFVGGTFYFSLGVTAFLITFYLSFEQARAWRDHYGPPKLTTHYNPPPADSQE